MAPIAFATHPVPRSGQSTALDDRLVHGFQSRTRKTERLARLASAPSSTQSPSRRRSESVRLLTTRSEFFNRIDQEWTYDRSICASRSSWPTLQLLRSERVAICPWLLF